MFCIRNPNGIEWEQGQWYDQTPSFKTPMDNYISLDRLTQDRVFAALDAIGRGERQVKERGDGYNFFRECGGEDSEINELTPTCCAGGPIEGHAYDCFMVIGFSFG